MSVIIRVDRWEIDRSRSLRAGVEYAHGTDTIGGKVYRRRLDRVAGTVEYLTADNAQTQEAPLQWSRTDVHEEPSR